jgi:D-arabinose 5-phosphate isomerase GutQ
MKQTAMEKARASIFIEAKAVSDVASWLDEPAFALAVDALCRCGKIITCASGSSGFAAMKFAHSLCCVERPAKFMPPSEAVHGGLGCVQEGDAVVMVSRGGKTAELLPIIRVCRQKKSILIAVTENMESPLAKNADILIPMKIEKESDPFNVMATASFLSTVAIFDAMLAAVMEETGYRLEQFALIHPGGAVGAQLNPEA